MKQNIKRIGMVALLLMVTRLISSAYDFQVDGIAYNFISDAENEVAVANKDESYSGDIVIPSSVDYKNNTYSVTKIGNYAFSQCDVTSIELPTTLTSIGSNAFNECYVLTSIEIPNSVTTIGNRAFFRCQELITIELPNSVTSIGTQAFGECFSLTNVELPNLLETIESSVFSHCIALKNIKIPNSVISIGNTAFFLCSELTNIEIPNSVTSIGYQAFSSCGLTSIEIPYSVTTIGDEAFSQTEIKSVIIPPTVTSIGKGTFDSNAFIKGAYPMTLKNPFDKNVISVEYPENSIIENGFIYSEDKTVLYYVPYSISGEYKISESVKTIGKYSFACCESLSSAEIPNSLTTIDENAFRGSGLISIDIPNSIESIGKNAFSDCEFLENVTIGEGLISTDEIFYNSPVKNAYINCVSIPDRLFEDIETLEKLTFGESVVKIGNNSFNRCFGLTYVDIPNSVTTIGQSAFGRTGLTTIKIPNSVNTIGAYAFYGCSGLTSVEIPNSVSDIADSVFEDCSNLISAPIPNSVITIGENAFKKCSSLTSLSIPNSVTTIGLGAFEGCNSIKSLTIGENITSIKSPDYRSPFKDCPIETAEINCISIPESLLYGIETLKDLNIGNSVTSIGQSAFSYCDGLTEIVIPNSVISIGENAFWRCINLNSVTVNWDIPIPCPMYCFDDNTYKDGVLNVPSEYWSDYILSSWNRFNNIYVDGLPIQRVDDGSFFYAFIPESGEAILMPHNNYNSLSTATIPDRVVVDGNFYYIVEIGSEAFKDCLSLANVVLPSKCEKIAKSAFEGCESLTSVEIPNSVATIGQSAFQGCTGLTTINIPNTVTIINNSVFQGCWGLTSIEIPNSVITIGQSAFERSGLTTIKIPNSVIIIGNSAFNNCSQLTNIEIPNSVIEIGDEAFYQCYKLNSVDIPNSVTTIGQSAFERSGLTTIKIPNSVNKIGAYAFLGSKIKKVVMGNSVEIIGSSAFSIGDLEMIEITDLKAWCNITFENAEANPLSDAKHLYLNDDEIVDLVIPYGVESIKSYSFYNGSSITSLAIPQSVKSIESYSFAKTGIVDFRIPSSVLTYSGLATSDCEELKTFTIDQSSIPVDITNGNLLPVNVTTLNIDRDLNFIDENAGLGIKTLKKVNLGTEVCYISEMFFADNKKLTEIVIPSTVEYIGESAFLNTGINNITIGAGITEIGDQAFSGINPENIYITALESPIAQNTVFSNIAGTLYVMPGCEDEYYNNPNCWYQFKYPTPMVVADGIEIKEEMIDGTLKLTATILPENVTLPYIFWSSSNPEVACVNPDGTVYVYDEEGTCEFTATTLYPDGPTATVSFDGGMIGAVEKIDANNLPESSHIFTLQGVCIKRNATPEDIKNLTKGLYMINGKKVMIK